MKKQFSFLCSAAGLLFMLLLGSFSWKMKTAAKITQDEAIRLAEAFVKRNGYTAAPADTSEYKLTFELFDRYEKNTAAVLNKRHNSLNPKAFCITYTDNQWNVGFLAATIHAEQLDSFEQNSNLPGRAVIVSDDGKEISMAHKDPLFSQFKKL